MAEQSRREAQRSKRTKAVEGDLSSLPLSSFLKYLEQGRKSGRLVVRSTAGSAFVEISNGILTQARNGELAGEEAIASLLHLTRGYFRFEEEKGISEPSVRDALPPVMAVQLAQAVRRDLASRPLPAPGPRAESPAGEDSGGLTESTSMAKRSRFRSPLRLAVRWGLVAGLVGVAVGAWIVRPSRPAEEAARFAVAPRGSPAERPAREEPRPVAGTEVLAPAESTSDPVRSPVSGISPPVPAVPVPAVPVPAVGRAEPAATPEALAVARPPAETGAPVAVAETPSRSQMPRSQMPRASTPPQRPPEPALPPFGEPSAPRLLIPEVWVGETVAAGPGVEPPRLNAPLVPPLSGAGRRVLRASGIRLRLLVSHTGTVMDAQLLDPDRLSARDIRRVLRAAARAELEPATKQGIPVSMWTEVTIRAE